MTKRFLLALLALGLAWGAATFSQTSPGTVAVRGVVEQYFAAHSTGDLAKMEGLLLPDAAVRFRTPRGPSSDGQIMAFPVKPYLEWYGGRHASRASMTFAVRRCDVRSYGDLADAWVILEIREQSKEGQSATMRAAATMQLVQHAGQWKIAAHAWTMESPANPLPAGGDSK